MHNLITLIQGRRKNAKDTITIYIYMPPRPSQCCGISHDKLCLSMTCSIYITSTANNKTIECNIENTSCDSKWFIYVIFCPFCKLQYVGQSNNLRARMNGHWSDYRHCAAGKINKILPDVPSVAVTAV